MFKNANSALKKRIASFINFSLLFRPKKMKHCTKTVPNGFLHKNRKKKRLERPLSANHRSLLDFRDPSGSLRASRGVPGACQNPLFFLKNSVKSRLELKNSGTEYVTLRLWDSRNSSHILTIVFYPISLIRVFELELKT